MLSTLNSNLNVSKYDQSAAVNGINGVSTFISGYGLKSGNVKQINLIIYVPNVSNMSTNIGKITDAALFPSLIVQREMIFNNGEHGLMYITVDGSIGIKIDKGATGLILNILETFL